MIQETCSGGLSTLCTDCGIDTLPVDAPRAEYYMIRRDLWRRHCSDARFLCVGCLESRIGRELTGWDFIDAPVNDLRLCEGRYAWSWRTPRLVDRLSRWGGGSQ
jgi:hypothetical protein